jgi:hypothetical protein
MGTEYVCYRLRTPDIVERMATRVKDGSDRSWRFVSFRSLWWAATSIPGAAIIDSLIQDRQHVETESDVLISGSRGGGSRGSHGVGPMQGKNENRR